MAGRTERKPMTFSVAREAAPSHVLTLGAAGVPKGETVTPSLTDRQQVGARVTKATYRQLKARAALSGVTVQALVEQAIDELLAKTTT